MPSTNRIRFFLRRIPICITVCAAAAAATPAFELGANFNEHLHAARVVTLDLTGVKWVRGFLPACEFLDGPRRLATDDELAGFQAAASSGRKIAITLKWDFRKSHVRVPAVGSAREAACFAWAVEAARVAHPDLLVLVNELFIDTDTADLAPDVSGAIPMVRFLERLAAHVHAAGLRSPAGAPLPLSCGGFTRLYRPENQTHPATRALLPWLAASPDVAYVNFHLHELTFEQFNAALDFMRTKIPGKPFVVTEFSLVWSLARHLEEPVGEGEAGREFATRYHCDAGQSVREYLNTAARTPVAEDEMHAFLRSRGWYDPHFLDKACDAMARHGVVLATYAYVQEASGLERAHSPMPKGAVPWRLNPVFLERLAASAEPDRLPVNPGIYDTFVRYQQR